MYTPLQPHNSNSNSSRSWGFTPRPVHDIVLQHTLVALANAARLSLERMARSEHSAGLEGFPQGAGGVATELFGRLVLERTGHEGMYVCGTCHPLLEQQQSHAWLELEGLIVDLTHDQFAGSGLKGWVFRTSPWHDNFACEAVPLSLLPERWAPYPYAAYSAMKRTADALAPLNRR